MPVTLPNTPLATEAELAALAAKVAALDVRVTTLEHAQPAKQPSPTGTYIVTATQAPIIDDAMNAWSLVATGMNTQIAVEKALAPPPPVIDPVTANVVKLGIDLVNAKRQIVQQNQGGSWYTTAAPGSPSASWRQIAGPDGPPPAPGATFKVQDGKLYTPGGAPFRVKGLAVPFLNWPDNPQVEAGILISNNAAQPLTSSLPGINAVRLICFQSINQCGMASLAAIQPIVDRLIAAGIVTLLDPHIYPGVLAGNDLNTVCARMAEYAAHYVNEPLVMFQTQNEPDPNTGDVNAMLRAIIGAIRGTGNQSPITICVDSYAGLDAAFLASQHNLLWDQHFYGWTSNYSTDQNAVNQNLASYLAAAAQYKSADGVIPVIIGEFGGAGFIGAPGTGFWGPDGGWYDNNWQQVVEAVYSNTSIAGYIQWLANVPDLFNAPNNNGMDFIFQQFPTYDPAVLTPGGRALAADMSAT